MPTTSDSNENSPRSVTYIKVIAAGAVICRDNTDRVPAAIDGEVHFEYGDTE